MSAVTHATASSAIPGLTRRLNDVRTFQIPRLRECRGPLSLHAELADELRQDLEDIARALEIEREVAEVMALDDVDGSAQEVRVKVEALKEEHKQCILAYRSALIHSKRAIIASKGSRSRYELDTTRIGETETAKGANGRAEGEPSTGFQGADDEVQTRTNEVTDALKRTTQAMQAELERSVLSVRMLETSTETLRSTSTLYTTYSSLLTSSSQIVKALERADWQDRILISAAFIFFLLVVGWILKKRVFDKVVGGVGWWVGGSRKLVMMGLGKGAADVAGVGNAVGAVQDIQGKGKGLGTAMVEALSSASTRASAGAQGSRSAVGESVTAVVTAMSEMASESAAGVAGAIDNTARRQHVEL